MSLIEQLPTFDELPIKPDYPPHSAWGLFGDDDQIGTLNLLMPERVAAAAQLVKTGQVFAMNRELESPHPPLFNRAWWPPGHIIGYEHTFTHTVYDLLKAVADGKVPTPNFDDGVKNQRALDAIERSAKSKQWEKVTV
jgi:predicted dehydrogenase